MKHLYYATIAALLLVSCADTKPSDKDKSEEATKEVYAPGTRRMNVEVDIYNIATLDDYNHAMEHYWDDFDFEAEEDVVAYDTIAIMQAFADYANLLSVERNSARRDSLLRSVMQRAEHSREVFDFMWYVAEGVLHDPNSPLRNDEMYIPMLEVITASPLLDEYDRIGPTYQLEMARQNRIGTVANDFTYRLANGQSGRLHNIDAEYVILMFSNPGCPMCREIQEEITSSPLINELTELGRVRTLSVYPDEDLEAWREHLPEMPSTWIVGYDKGMRLTAERSYNLSAIPSLYLLDDQKRVIIKDGTSVAQIENAIAYLEAM